MTRNYADWERDARTSRKSLTKLGNELRDRWPEWKASAPYDSWEECVMAELGLTAGALRDRNLRARKNLTVSSQDAEPQPVRQKQGKPAGPAEVERRRTHVGQLRNDGWGWDPIREAVGVSDGTLRTDLVALGLEGKAALPRQKGAKPEGDFRWRNEDLCITSEESTIEIPSFAACETPSAKEAIEDVRVQLSLILGGRYRLSLKDRNNLITILTNALGRLHNGNQESQDPPASTRVAG